jgi:hypothetical protein
MVGWVLFVASLFLPAIALVPDAPRLRGFWCVLFGWPFFVTNGAVALAPIACCRMKDVTGRRVFSILLHLSFLAAVVVPPLDQFVRLFVGYWVWVIAVGATALGVREHWRPRNGQVLPA